MNSGSSKTEDKDRTYVSPVAQGEVIDAAEKAKTRPVAGLAYDYSGYTAPSTTATEQAPTPKTDTNLG